MSKNLNSEVLPCGCGNKEPILVQRRYDGGAGLVVWCRSCSAEGPTAFPAEAAVDAWNDAEMAERDVDADELKRVRRARLERKQREKTERAERHERERRKALLPGHACAGLGDMNISSHAAGFLGDGWPAITWDIDDIDRWVGPINYCPGCGEKLPVKVNDPEATGENDR